MHGPLNVKCLKDLQFFSLSRLSLFKPKGSISSYVSVVCVNIKKKHYWDFLKKDSIVNATTENFSAAVAKIFLSL